MPQTPTGGQDLAVLPPHIPDEESRRKVRTMAACGLSEDQICDILPCSKSDFERCYRDIFRNGVLMANVEVGSQVLAAAVDRNHPQFFQCATFWLRARGGWRDVRAVSTENQVPEEQKAKLIEQIIERLTVPVEIKQKVG